MGATVIVEGPGVVIPGGCEEAGFTVRFPAGTPFKIVPRPGLRSFVEVRLSSGKACEGVILYEEPGNYCRWFVGLIGQHIPAWLSDDQILRVLDGPLPDRDPAELVDFTRDVPSDDADPQDYPEPRKGVRP